MHRTRLSAALIAALSIAACLATTGTARAEIPPGLFSNYYVGPPGHPAQMYVSPRPTPPFVGHTWITYPPLSPHEFLYKHNRVYTRLNADGTTTTTRVRYSPLTWYH
jgi:hypothetical protein